MDGAEGPQKVFRILSYGVPTVVILGASYALLVDEFFLIPGAIVRRLTPNGFDALVAGVYGLFSLAFWSALHGVLLHSCFGGINTSFDDLCAADPLRYPNCIATSVAALILINFGSFPQRSIELYIGFRRRSRVYHRLIEAAPGIVAWMAVAERDTSGVLLLLVLTALRMAPAGPKVATLGRWWARTLKLLIGVLTVRTLRGDCGFSPVYAVGASLGALCAE